LDILDVYKECYEDLLAVPVIKGRKTEEEKFAGALHSHSLELFIPGSCKGL
jgi:prolyl-tRNA synthetase